MSAAVGNYPYGLIIVPFSATPTFDCSQGNVFLMTLTGNVTSFTLTNPMAGMVYTFIFKQDGSGLHSVAWPATFKGIIPITITAVASTSAVQTVIYDGTNFYAISLGLINL
jgi:hypothetical protein